ncbi:hypothetical protein Cni_G16027 [Canna indica]|uniref:Uncharacterized protein n=1 Tax=Canna indica TaxID=4628 RepID=A0AAQ3KES9_9LILI|nr:hypothetical protein Cni_G16027 [Canna indica]
MREEEVVVVWRCIPSLRDASKSFSPLCRIRIHVHRQGRQRRVSNEKGGEGEGGCYREVGVAPASVLFGSPPQILSPSAA